MGITMKRIESIEDDMRGVVTFEAENGQRICMDARMAQEYGPAELLRSAGLPTPTERLPVIHHGQRVGLISSQALNINQQRTVGSDG